MTKIIQLGELAADPAPVADSILIYSKEVSGVTELFGRASDGTISQLTPPGVIVQTSAPPPPTPDPPTSDFNFLGIALTSDGQFGYVGNQNTGENRPLWKFRTSDNMWLESIQCGDAPSYVTTALGVNKAYVSNFGDGTVSVIDMTTDTVIATIPGFTQPVVLDVTPDNSTVYVCDYLANQVIRIDVATDTIVGAPIAVPSPIALTVSPDGLKVYVSSGSNVAVISTVTNLVTTTIIGLTSPNDIVFKPDGTEAYVRDTGTTIRRIDVATDSLTGAAIALGALCMPGLAITTTGTPKVFVPMANGDIQVISTATNLVTATIVGVGADPFGLQRAAAVGTNVYLTQFGAFGPANVFYVDGATDTYVQPVAGVVPPPPPAPTVLGRFSTLDFSAVDAADEGGGVVSIAAGVRFIASENAEQAATLAVSPDGLTLYGGDQQSDSIKVFSTVDNSLLATIPSGTPGGMVVTPDGAFLYAIILSSGAVLVIDTATNLPVTTIPGVFGTQIIVSPDGAYVYSFSQSGEFVSVIEVATNTVIATPPTGLDPFAMAITPDGAYVVVVNNSDSTVTVIETTTFTVLTTVALTQVNPISVVASPDSAHIYVGTADGYLTKIETTTWTEDGAPLLLIPAGVPFKLQITAGNTYLYAATASNVRRIALIDFSLADTTPDLSPASLTNFLLSPDGFRLYLPYDNSTLAVIDATDITTIIATPTVGSNTIDMVSTPNSAKIYMTDGDSSIRMLLAVDNTVTLFGTTLLGPFKTLSIPNATITDLGDEVALVELAGGSSGYAFVFQPGGEQIANQYTDWGDLTAAMSLVLGPKLLQFDDQFEAILIPVGDWDMTDTVWEGIDQNFGGDTPPTTVTFDDGAVVNGLRTVRGLYLICAGAPAILDLNGSDVFTFEDYAVMGGDDNAIIDLSNLDEKSNVILSIRHGAQVRSQQPPITGLAESITVDVDSMSLFDGQTVIGTGTVRITKSTLNQDTVALQDLAGGVIVTNRLGGFNLQSNSGYQLFPGIVEYWTINGAQIASLTPAAWNPGGCFVVKHAGTSGTVTVTPSGAETVDGNPTHVINPGGAVIMVSDGVSNYMIIGEKV